MGRRGRRGPGCRRGHGAAAAALPGGGLGSGSGGRGGRGWIGGRGERGGRGRGGRDSHGPAATGGLGRGRGSKRTFEALELENADLRHRLQEAQKEAKRTAKQMQRELEASEERLKAARGRANAVRMRFSRCKQAIGRGHNRRMADGSIARFEKVISRVGSKQRALESMLVEAPGALQIRSACARVSRSERPPEHIRVCFGFLRMAAGLRLPIHSRRLDRMSDCIGHIDTWITFPPRNNQGIRRQSTCSFP